VERGALKGALLGLAATAFAASIAAAYYGHWGWVLPDEQSGIYRGFLDLAVDFATSDQPTGAVALLASATVAAVICGMAVGRRAGQAAGAPAERSRRITRAGLVGYLAAAMAIPIALGVVSGFLHGRFDWSLPLLWLYGLIGAIAFLPIAVVPIVGALLALELWTRPKGTDVPRKRSRFSWAWWHWPQCWAALLFAAIERRVGTSRPRPARPARCTGG
jgi:MFS family permease